jgi:hypothetical protein
VLLKLAAAVEVVHEPAGGIPTLEPAAAAVADFPTLGMVHSSTCPKHHKDS